MHGREHASPYHHLFIMVLLSFMAMYVLMYAMVDRAANIHPSFNQAYMAGLMTAPMVVLELLLMIANARSFEMQMKSLQTADTNAQSANKLLAYG